jgi:CBS domain-containing protein
MTLKEILAAKGSHVYTIHPEATLQDVVEELVQHNIGALNGLSP